jgi:hypothetical protein
MKYFALYENHSYSMPTTSEFEGNHFKGEFMKWHIYYVVNETAHLGQIAFENMVTDEKTLHLPDSKCHWQIQAQYFLDHTTIVVKRRLH